MNKHQFVKENCDCMRRATRFVCKHCGALEYRSERELKRLTLAQAECDDPAAPRLSAKERFKGQMGGAVDCLSPDFETYMKDSGQCAGC